MKYSDKMKNTGELMNNEIKVALIGLDTSHTVEFARRMQDPVCPPEHRVSGLRSVSCLRFETPFQAAKGLDTRQKQLEEIGVAVTSDFNEAVKGCDAVMIEINDPSFHLEYFQKCASLGKPIFLDKPLADNIQKGAEIVRISQEKGIRMFSSSPLRFVEALLGACTQMPKPLYATIYGPLGKSPSGSSIVWYGVHAFEMLERAMGIGASSVTVNMVGSGAVAVVDYADRRRGVVELTTGVFTYGGCLRDASKSVPYSVDMGMAYTLTLGQVRDFFHGSGTPVSLDDTLEVMGMLDAAERSAQSGKTETIYKR